MSVVVLYLSVAIGGAIGACLRFGFGRWTTGVFGVDFPWGTLGANVIGAFCMGVAAALLVERYPGDFGRFAPFVMTGVLGGFTTFSAFSLEVFRMIEKGDAGQFMLYTIGSVALTLLALWSGIALGRAV